MKKMLVLLAVAMIAANSVGCACRRLCPWLDRGAACCPMTPAAASLVGSPAPYCPPQYGAPMVSPLAAQVANPCAPACTYWDPCQCAVVAQPGFGQAGLAQQCCPQPGLAQPFAQPGFAQPGFAQPSFAQPGVAQPMVAGPGMMSFVEQDCGFVAEAGCGEPFMGAVGYGPSFGGDCAACGVVSEGAFSAPAPEAYDPGPVSE